MSIRELAFNFENWISHHVVNRLFYRATFRFERDRCRPEWKEFHKAQNGFSKAPSCIVRFPNDFMPPTFERDGDVGWSALAVSDKLSKQHDEMCRTLKNECD